MSLGHGTWRPLALNRVEHTEKAPIGFEKEIFSGRGPLSALSCTMIEPSKLDKPSDWADIVDKLEPWGEVPDTSSIEEVTISEDFKGPIAHLQAEIGWIAEFLPWGSDGLLRMRAEEYPESCELPCGGYSSEGSEIILIRKEKSLVTNSRELLSDAFQDEDKEKSSQILRTCGKLLGTLHSHIEEVMVTPSDPNRWNSRIAEIEEALRSHSIWRVPYSRDSECMLSIGDVRLDDFRGDSIRIGRPRLSDALQAPGCGFPAIRDLASLAHDLSRLHFETGSQLDIVDLRLSLIEGWRESAPTKWSSENVFYSHRGGLAIWEYEQCLLDVIEATSNQSGAPQPAVGLIAYVPGFQKKMFNNRTIGALSIMSGFFGFTTLFYSLPPTSLDQMITPSLCFLASFALMMAYRKMSPSPELPFNRLR